MNTDDQKPPPRCPKHLDEPTEARCGACGEARRALALWEALDRAGEDEDEPDGDR